VLEYEPGAIVVFGTGSAAEFEAVIQAMRPQLVEIAGDPLLAGSND